MYICLLPYLFVILILLDIILTFFLYRSSSSSIDELNDHICNNHDKAKNEYEAVFYLTKNSLEALTERITKLEKDLLKFKRKSSTKERKPKNVDIKIGR